MCNESLTGFLIEYSDEKALRILSLLNRRVRPLLAFRTSSFLAGSGLLFESEFIVLLHALILIRSELARRFLVVTEVGSKRLSNSSEKILEKYPKPSSQRNVVLASNICSINCQFREVHLIENSFENTTISSKILPTPHCPYFTT